MQIFPYNFRMSHIYLDKYAACRLAGILHGSLPEHCLLSWPNVDHSWNLSTYEQADTAEQTGCLMMALRGRNLLQQIKRKCDFNDF
jgi:hypothetical protein